mmetsp:Transcript_17020/g.21705  ORF Transcript_17020/g.21705 Transcript_17020/m.21705 type:complete len:128 (+) Transcript_17020:427-810(+)
MGEALRIPSKETIVVAQRSLQDEIDSKKHVKANAESTGVKEELCQQGGLQTLLTLLTEEQQLHKKIPVIEIISKLLLRNVYTQNQFKEIKGYNSFIQLFDNLDTKHSTSSQSVQSIGVRSFNSSFAR